MAGEHGAAHPVGIPIPVAAPTEAPTPDLPRGAGGPPSRRAAGRVSSPTGHRVLPSAAAVLEPDSLVRLLVVPAVAALGFSVVGECEAAASGRGPAAVFVALDRGDDCRRVCKAARDGFHADGRRPLVVGYGVGAAPLLTAHRVHGCADAVLMLAALAGRPCFVHLPTTDPVTAAGLTAREADVLVLLLSGLPTAAVAARLSISAHTARSHCRAVLRKFGVGDRATLRTTLLTGAADPSPAALGAALPRFA